MVLRAGDHVEECLSEWLDGRLPDRQAAIVRDHLGACGDCGDAAEGLRRTRSLLRSAPSREVPDGLFSPEAVGRRAMLFPRGIPSEPPPAHRGRRSRRMASVAAGVAMLLVSVSLVTGDSGPQQPIQPFDMSRLLADHQAVTSGPGVSTPSFVEAGLPDTGPVTSGEMVTMEWLTGPDSTAVVSRTMVGTPAEAPVSARSVSLADKYDTVVGDLVEIMDRLCRRMDIRLAADGSLREQVWIDESTGLLLRRETFQPEDTVNPVRLVSYLDVDFPEPTDAAAGQPVAPGYTGRVQALDGDSQVSALRRAGWVVPSTLPNGYVQVGAYVGTDSAGTPLQLVFSDGLYAVSLFAQSGTSAMGDMPDGAVAIEGLSDHVGQEWPGLSPSRMIWSDGEHTFTLMGNAPREEMLAIVAAMPATPDDSPSRHIRSALSWLLPS